MILKNIRDRDLWIPREEAQELDEDEYYIADLLGMKVLLEDGSEFGTLKKCHGNRSKMMFIL